MRREQRAGKLRGSHQSHDSTPRSGYADGKSLSFRRDSLGEEDEGEVFTFEVETFRIELEEARKSVRTPQAYRFRWRYFLEPADHDLGHCLFPV